MDTDSDPSRERLDAAMDEQRLELGLRWNQVAERAGMTYGNLHKIRKGDTALTGLAKAGIERALEWPRGHIDKLLNGSEDTGDPLTAQQERLLGVYRNDYLPKYGQARALELLQQDVDAINAAIEREQRDTG